MVAKGADEIVSFGLVEAEVSGSVGQELHRRAGVAGVEVRLCHFSHVVLTGNEVKDCREGKK